MTTDYITRNIERNRFYDYQIGLASFRCKTHDEYERERERITAETKQKFGY